MTDLPAVPRAPLAPEPPPPATTTARFDLAAGTVTVGADSWPLPAGFGALPPYDLVARLYEITGRWHILPEPKPVDAAGRILPNSVRLPARGAHWPAPGVLVVDVEEIHPPQDEQG